MSKQIPEYYIEEKLFGVFTQFILRFITNINKLFSKIQNQYEEALNTFDEQYENFKIYSHWLNKLFNYLDRFYTKKKESNLYTEAFKLFKKEFFD